MIGRGYERTEILGQEVAHWRTQPHQTLLELVGVAHHYTRVAPSGAEYGLGTVVWQDGRGSDDLRVIISISGKGWSPFHRSSRDFIVALDGGFVGE
jgi:hypothetical protein